MGVKGHRLLSINTYRTQTYIYWPIPVGTFSEHALQGDGWELAREKEIGEETCPFDIGYPGGTVWHLTGWAKALAAISIPPIPIKIRYHIRSSRIREGHPTFHFSESCIIALKQHNYYYQWQNILNAERFSLFPSQLDCFFLSSLLGTETNHICSNWNVEHNQITYHIMLITFY